MYTFNPGSRPAAAPRRSRILREDIAVDPMLAQPAADPAVDPAIAGIVTAVEAVEAQTKRYRATVTRTVTETALVEFDAPETADLYVMAEALLPQIPADAWVESSADSWGYIDRIEPVDVAPASEAPVEQTLSDDMTPVEDEEDPLAPPAAASRHRIGRRRARMTGVALAGCRMARRTTGDEAIASATDILARADAVVAMLPATMDEAATQIEQLAALDAEMVALEGTLVSLPPEESAGAFEFISNALIALEDMRYALEETAASVAVSETYAPAYDPAAAAY